MKHLDNLSIKELLCLIQTGNTDAFGEVYKLYRRKVYCFAYRFVRSSEEANELTQDVFVRLWENRMKINPDKNFEAYLFSMVRSNFLDALKKQARMSVYRTANAEEPAFNSTESYMDFTECRQIAMNAIETLSPQVKVAYLLSREDGCSHEDISRQMGLSKNTVNNHIKKSLTHIRTRIRYLSPDTVLPFVLLMLASFPEMC
ncbi:RNA polymerase sigma-70 factor, ECF subfamily [Mucilaginibacter sp. OK268]|uniref:RNA polymerase sigma-70 factor n=1 Tax=Mucilaginibacter sp. OK268 TaxID=1881048 RepID=UPI00089013CD|nr:RNA polymerase sigma-70 factor [Mucilaginibacter sp. OK268]SDP99842.1 RNA polymerase sigma-70 factor, ECF subfamily [Mucilaginibacter sp. OK268]